jgi:hypothetical protein
VSLLLIPTQKEQAFLPCSLAVPVICFVPPFYTVKQFSISARLQIQRGKKANTRWQPKKEKTNLVKKPIKLRANHSWRTLSQTPQKQTKNPRKACTVQQIEEKMRMIRGTK